MHAGLLSLWVTVALLLPQCLGDTEDYDYEFAAPTSGYTDYTDFTLVYEYDSSFASTIDYDMYVTPDKGNKHEQTEIVREEAVNGAMNQINDEASTVFRCYAVGLGLIVQRFCQQT